MGVPGSRRRTLCRLASYMATSLPGSALKPVTTSLLPNVLQGHIILMSIPGSGRCTLCRLASPIPLSPSLVSPTRLYLSCF